jgi:hypothetical protein
MSSSALAVSSTGVLIFAIFSTLFVIKNNIEKLETPEFREKFGTLTAGLRTEHLIGRYWTIITLVRWTTLCVIVVVLSDYPQF